MEHVYAAGPEGWGVYRWDRLNPFSPLVRTSGQADKILAPGFVDIHIHGAFGIDFMTATSSEMTSLADRLDNIGYEAFLPTTVTSGHEDVTRALANMPDDPRIVGFHLEGPFLSPLYPGAQPSEFIESPTTDEWDDVLNDRRLRVITIAPEIEGALPLIRRLSSRGVRVSFGHTDATFAQCQAGFDAGGRATTHTYNAMRPLHHREAGTVGFALAQESMSCELIYDRIHVCREAAEILVQAKGPFGVVAVSDSTLATGLPEGELVTMWGHHCVTGQKTVRIAESGALAGSAVTLADVFRNLVQDFGAETAVQSCSINPRRAIGMTSPPKKLNLLSLNGDLEDSFWDRA